METLAGAPVLILSGEADAIIPAADAQRMHELAPASRVEIIPGAGHMVPVEKPAELAASLRRFLNELGL